MRPTRRTTAVLLVLLAASLLAGSRGEGAVRTTPTAVVSQLGHGSSGDAAVVARASSTRLPSVLPLVGGTRPPAVEIPHSTGTAPLAAPASGPAGVAPTSEPARGPPGS